MNERLRKEEKVKAFRPMYEKKITIAPSENMSALTAISFIVEKTMLTKSWEMGDRKEV